MSSFFPDFINKGFVSKDTLISTSSYEELTTYISDCIRLAKSLIIKHDETVDLMNMHVQEITGQPISSDPLEWKYYLNINGSAYSGIDVPMYVRSLDNHESIEFSKLLLARHLNTAKGYEIGTARHKRLVLQYPMQTSLIRGILSPIDPIEALRAKDGDILHYDKSLVDPQERTLINSIGAAIKRFRSRWNNTAYYLTDPLYPAQQYGLLLDKVILTIFTERWKRCDTDEAHTFHIKQKLGSHGLLDRFIDDLSLEQQLYLYRNIRYLKKHSGHTSVFLELIENLATASNIPVHTYIYRHTSSLIGQEVVDGFSKEPINRLAKKSNKVLSHYDLDREVKGIAPGNTDRLVMDQREAFRGQVSTSSPTKVIELTSPLRRTLTGFSLIDMSIAQWHYMAATGRYLAIVSILDPVTLQEHTLSVSQAHIVSLYLTYTILGIEPTRLPECLVSIYGYSSAVAEDSMRFDNVISTIDFNNRVEELYSEYINSVMDTLSSDFNESCASDLSINNSWKVRVIDNHEEKDVGLWLEENSLSFIRGLSKDQAKELLVNIVELCIGRSLDDLFQNGPEVAIKGILEQLSSYTVAFVAEGDSVEAKPLYANEVFSVSGSSDSIKTHVDSNALTLLTNNVSRSRSECVNGIGTALVDYRVNEERIPAVIQNSDVAHLSAEGEGVVYAEELPIFISDNHVPSELIIEPSDFDFFLKL